MWYQDTPGLALGQCLEANRFCELPLPGEELNFNPFLPVDFPANFPIEFSYFLAEAFVANPLSPLKGYDIGLEGGFLNEAIVDGEQIAFGFMSLRVDNLPAGNYRIIHPYGVEIFRDLLAGGRIRVDPLELGLILTPLDFEAALSGSINCPAGICDPATALGPFLQSDDPANKDVLDPLTGNIYLTNPLTPVTVTGSPNGTNFVRVEQVELDALGNVTAVLAEIAFTDQFLLFGKKAATLDIAPQTLVFPEQNVAPVFNDMTVTVTNTSALRTPALGQITITGPNAADFTVPDDECSNQAIDPSETCAFTVRFSGVANGADRTAVITIPSGANEFSPITIPVSGAIDSIPPVVTVTFPAGGGAAPANMKIIAQFDDAMDPLTINPTTFTITAVITSGGSPVTGTVLLDANSNIAVFTPDAPLIPGVMYTATIAGGAGGAADSVGNPMQADFIWSFTGAAADNAPPSVTSANPANGGSGFPTGNALTVTFSETMLGFTVNTNTVTVNSGTGQLSGTVAFDVQTNTASFTPSNPLQFGAPHTLTVTGVQDLAGNNMAAGFTASFVTNFRPPAAQLLAPLNASTGVSRPVTLRWSRPVDQDGDPVGFRVSVCNNASFTGSGPDCQLDVTVTASAQSKEKVFYAGAGFLGMTLGLAGVVIAGSGNRRRMMMIALIAPAIIAGMLLYSCGGGGGGNGAAVTPQAQQDEDVSVQVSGLSSGITFFWKVESDDGKGGTTVSPVFTFTTQ